MCVCACVCVCVCVCVCACVCVRVRVCQWQGWVPSASSCPGGGSLAGSKFSVRNVKVMGVVVQGQEPRKCD